MYSIALIQYFTLFSVLTSSFAANVIPPGPLIDRTVLGPLERQNHPVLHTSTVYATVCASAPVLFGSSAASLSNTVPHQYSSASSSTSTPRPSCPSIWKEIVADMKHAFAGCNVAARSSIRFGFHDAAGYSSLTPPYGPATGGADGSLLLSAVEVARAGNAPLPAAQAQMKARWDQYRGQNVSAADFVQMSALMAVRSCGGPAYEMLVGREDDSTPCPDGTLPAAFGVNSTYAVLVQLWAEKGIDARELAALVGAHTVSQAFSQQANGIPAGGPQDTTDSKWDTTYFKDTQAKTAPAGVYRFESDLNLGAANTTTGQAFTEFGNDLDEWNKAYSAAAYKLSLLGVPQSKMDMMADCSELAL